MIQIYPIIEEQFCEVAKSAGIKDKSMVSKPWNVSLTCTLHPGDSAFVGLAVCHIPLDFSSGGIFKF